MEDMSDFMQIAKDYAKAEKELEVQDWVYISIERKDEIGKKVRLFVYDLPREVLERRRWVIRWREAALRCKYPKDDVTTYYCYYDKRLGTDRKLNDDLKKIIATKAQVTKVRREVAEYIAYNKENNIFFDENTDEILQKAREKLAKKLAAVQAAEERLKLNIEQIKDKNQIKS